LIVPTGKQESETRDISILVPLPSALNAKYPDIPMCSAYLGGPRKLFAKPMTCLPKDNWSSLGETLTRVRLFYVVFIQWNFTQPWRKMKSYHLQVNGWNWRTSFWSRSARLRRPEIVCSLSYVDFWSRANAAMWLDLDHMTRREHIREIEE
jgi:hypothetical protein